MGQVSSIELLPEDILEQLQALLRDPRCVQLEVVGRINAILDERGIDEQITKSSLNRYKLKMDKAGKKLRDSREMARMWIAQMGAEPQGQVGHLVNEVLRTLAFDMTLHLQEGEITEDRAPATVQMLKGLALTMQRLEKAASLNVQRENEIRKAALEAAAEAAGQTASQAGISAETIQAIRRDVLRMAE